MPPQIFKYFVYSVNNDTRIITQDEIPGSVVSTDTNIEKLGVFFDQEINGFDLDSFEYIEMNYKRPDGKRNTYVIDTISEKSSMLGTIFLTIPLIYDMTRIKGILEFSFTFIRNKGDYDTQIFRTGIGKLNLEDTLNVEYFKEEYQKEASRYFLTYEEAINYIMN